MELNYEHILLSIEGLKNLTDPSIIIVLIKYLRINEMSVDKINQFRSAVIEPGNNQHILEALVQYLPEGYELLKEKATEDLGFDELIYIKTPTDKIQLYVPQDGKCAKTLHIVEQDKRNNPPTLTNDELSILALKLNKNENLKMRVFASQNDLEGK